MIEYKSLNDLVYEEIRNRIISNQYRPGQKLDVDSIAAELKVSRTPITNSLKALEKDGYVTILQRSGTYIRKYSKEEIDALFDFRAALEEVVVKRIIDKADHNTISLYIKQFQDYINSLDIEDLPSKMKEFDELQQEFHRYLWNQCPEIIYNELYNVMLLTRQITVRHINFYIDSPDALRFARNEILIHISLAKAILSGNINSALQYIKEDIIGTKEDILRHFDEIGT